MSTRSLAIACFACLVLGLAAVAGFAFLLRRTLYIDREHITLNCTIVTAAYSVCDRPPGAISCAVVEVKSDQVCNQTLHETFVVGYGLNTTQIAEKYTPGASVPCFALLGDCELLPVANDHWLGAGIVLSSVLTGFSSLCAFGCLLIAVFAVCSSLRKGGTETRGLLSD
jgi:hypothetical protein